MPNQLLTEMKDFEILFRPTSKFEDREYKSFCCVVSLVGGACVVRLDGYPFLTYTHSRYEIMNNNSKNNNKNKKWWWFSFSWG